MLGFLLFRLRLGSGAEEASGGGAGTGTVEGRGGTSTVVGEEYSSGAETLLGLILSGATKDFIEEVFVIGVGASFLDWKPA